MFLILLKNEPTSRIKCVGVTTKIIFILLRLAIIGGMIGLTVWAIRNILPIAWNMNKVNVWDDEAGIAVSSCSKFNAVVTSIFKGIIIFICYVLIFYASLLVVVPIFMLIKLGPREWWTNLRRNLPPILKMLGKMYWAMLKSAIFNTSLMEAVMNAAGSEF